MNAKVRHRRRRRAILYWRRLKRLDPQLYWFIQELQHGGLQKRGTRPIEIRIVQHDHIAFLDFETDTRNDFNTDPHGPNARFVHVERDP